MRGLMQHQALTLDSICDHAARWHGAREVVSFSGGVTVRTDYASIRDRARRLSTALQSLGVDLGDRVATLAWNSAAHLEAWFAITGIGAICHTLNPRLFAEQIAWIINHAGDKVILVDPELFPLMESLLPNCPAVERVIVLGGDDESFQLPPGFSSSGALIASHSPDIVWGNFDENTAAGLCYTSGTTGNPKGVLYSHRSNYLHTLTTIQPDVFGLSSGDVVLPAVPMFHANAWGLTYCCPAVGAKLVLPGSRLDGASLHALIEQEGVTFAAAVPTVWQTLLKHLHLTGGRLSTLRRVVVGGAAAPESIVRAFHDRFGVAVLHAWGMTETSPVGTCFAATPAVAPLPFEKQLRYRLKQGRPPLLVDIKVVDDAKIEQPRDGKTAGRLLAKGPFVAAEYYREGAAATGPNGYFDTGDIATIDDEGFLQIVDRAKDVIKSGGEWISSIEIENLVLSHPAVAIAAVVGIPDAKWDERPLLLVKLKGDQACDADAIRRHLNGKIASWWMPEDIRLVSDIPTGATGKIDKKAIRRSLSE
ncbi:long-chain fatty acid--CoA ligase [Hephaestia mangrovi]|uniref:long-chain fatty acid--CoA ligase n=1 Tax=Hephaestia mangrovi TaxID=2873268 RepID=UPI001CA6F50C|nr:long-chain fatty acid--CoA ligase [Hephaestia mangrovi]MBY8829903.1 long-chain fatty acid--CoA ligase [Hephaestia mangrovi]